MGRQTVVLVDGDVRSLDTRASQLVIGGYEVQTAAGAHAARGKLRLGADALVLCSKGIEPWAVHLLRGLRAGEMPGAKPELPVVAVGADDERALLRCCAVEVDFALPSCSSPLLLAAALKALERRRGRERRTLLVANVVIDREAHRVKVNGEPIHLTPIEFEMLEALALRPGCTIAHDALARRLWREGADSVATLCRLRTHVAGLRRKLQETDAAVTVKSIYGIGFVLTATKTKETVRKRSGNREDWREGFSRAS